MRTLTFGILLVLFSGGVNAALPKDGAILWGGGSIYIRGQARHEAFTLRHCWARTLTFGVPFVFVFQAVLTQPCQKAVRYFGEGNI